MVAGQRVLGPAHRRSCSQSGVHERATVTSAAVARRRLVEALLTIFMRDGSRDSDGPFRRDSCQPAGWRSSVAAVFEAMDFTEAGYPSWARVKRQSRHKLCPVFVRAGIIRVNPSSTMNVRLFSLVLLTAFLAACESDPTPTGSAFPPTNADKIMFLKRPPPQPYVELGTVRDVEVYYPPGTKATSLAIGENTDVRAKLCEKAAALGADAIVLKEERVVDAIDATSGGNSHIWALGVAIHFTQPPQKLAATDPN